MPIFTLKAGRAFRRGDTNTVEPAPGRGLVYLEQEDGLLHLYYKDLQSNELIEDLILFPGDASFVKAAPRVHCLKFNSSESRLFFWHQDVDTSKDDDNAAELNRLIGAQLDGEDEGGMEVEASAQPASSIAATPAPATRQAPSAPGAPQKAPSSSNAAAGSDQMSAMQAFLDNLAAQSGSSTGGGSSSQAPAFSYSPDFVLPAVLPNSVLNELLADPAAVEALLPFIPSELPQTTESLRAALLSPEFRRSTGALDRALRTGALGPLTAGLGLGQEAAQGVEQFLEGVQKQADAEKGDRMEE